MAFVFSQKVLFKHCDPAGIVFYPRYFEMINDCVEAFFDKRLGVPFETLHKDGGAPTARIETRFKAPSRHGDHLEIHLCPTRIGRSSLDLKFLACCDDKTRFEATSTLVYVGTDLRSTRWPERLHATLSEMIGTSHEP